MRICFVVLCLCLAGCSSDEKGAKTCTGGDGCTGTIREEGGQRYCDCSYDVPASGSDAGGDAGRD